jgi:hypothetical protein
MEERIDFFHLLWKKAALLITPQIGGGSIYESSYRLIPVQDYTQVVFTLNFWTIPMLEGWITSRTGGSLPFVLVQVCQNGVTFSTQRVAAGRNSPCALCSAPMPPL